MTRAEELQMSCRGQSHRKRGQIWTEVSRMASGCLRRAEGRRRNCLEVQQEAHASLSTTVLYLRQGWRSGSMNWMKKTLIQFSRVLINMGISPSSAYNRNCKILNLGSIYFFMCLCRVSRKLRSHSCISGRYLNK